MVLHINIACRISLSTEAWGIKIKFSLQITCNIHNVSRVNIFQGKKKVPAKNKPIIRLNID